MSRIHPHLHRGLSHWVFRSSSHRACSSACCYTAIGICAAPNLRRIRSKTARPPWVEQTQVALIGSGWAKPAVLREYPEADGTWFSFVP